MRPRNAGSAAFLVFLLILLPAGLARSGSKPVVRFGVIPRYNPLVMFRSYQPIMDYLTESTPYRFELKVARSYDEAVQFLADRDVELASLGDVTFVEAYRSFGAVPLVRPLNADGRPYYRSVIIVRKDSPIRDLSDLKGKRVAFGSVHSTSGNLIPRFFLFRHGVRIEDLASATNLGKHDIVAKAVLKGEYDAGAVKDVVAERYRRHGLRFLARSDPIPSVPIVAHPATDPAVREAVKRALLAVDPENPVFQERLSQWDPEFRHGFVEARTEDYRPIFGLMDSFEGTCGGRCHR
ncbi:phosphate/phosphite/phosphonate ABC transporter substrate-binding protein [Deferrisoma camini]|uniref:phosphate/phosphite/phosphonate ABC transporter substrate-binding protein n=1 Tax=Deferrisoma camini TaxID=1035120 RepID=UPI00046D376F|nr:phosphate/phosphite/phosphonate ABC transporter substrate-binding protein [Deferrisoma camini]